MSEQVRPDEAAQALAEIRHRQEHVVDLAMLPAWYWRVVAALMVAGGPVLTRILRRIMLDNRSGSC